MDDALPGKPAPSAEATRAGLGLPTVTTTARDTDESPSSTAARRSWRDRLPDATPALLGYVAVRAVDLLIFFLFARYHGADGWHFLNARFDSGWYRGIAENGYDSGVFGVLPDGRPRASNLAFFPLYPALIALVMAVTPASSAVAGLVVSWLSGVAAAWGMYAIGRHLRDRTTGVLLAMLWGVVPHALVQNLAYSEALFTALAAWALYALLRRSWLAAGLLSTFAGLARPTANAVIAAVGLAALVAIVRRRDGIWPWVALLLSPVGYVGYLAWVGQRLGRLDGYFYMQHTAWGIEFDGGVDTVRTLREVLTEPVRLQFYVVTLVIAVALGLLVLLVADRYPLPVVVYAAVTVAFVLGAGGGAYYGKGRYLMPAFTLLLPVAAALAAARWRVRAVVLTLMTLGAGWYGSYLFMVWKASP